MKKPTIALERVTLTEQAGEVLIRHIKTGTEVLVSKKKLDAWAVSQLRQELSKPAGEMK